MITTYEWMSVWSTRLCLTLVHSLWQSAVIVFAAGGICRLSAYKSPERTYRVYVAALLLAVLCLPVTFMLLGKPNVATHYDVASAREVVAPRAESTNNVARRVPANATHAEEPRQAALIRTESAAKNTTATNTTERVVFPTSPELVTRSSQLAPFVAIAYLIGVLLMLSRIALGIVRVETLRSQSQPVIDGPLFEMLERLVDAWSMRVAPSLAIAEEIVVPKIIGLMKPTILIPASALTGLSTDQLTLIVAHELAHVRRYDIWVNLVQRLTEAVLFFSPSIWFINRRINREREFCCDQLACAVLCKGKPGAELVYATALLRVAELAYRKQEKGKLAIATLGVDGGSPSELRQRIRRLFGDSVNEPLLLSRSSLWIVLLLGVLAVAQLAPITQAQNTTVDNDSPEQSRAEVVEAGQGEAGKAQSSDRAEANRVVAAARAATFGLNGVKRIAFSQNYRQTNGGIMPGDAEGNLSSLWKARALRVPAPNLQHQIETQLAWDEDRLLVSRNSTTADASWTQTKYWDGSQGWIGETPGNHGDRNVYRYGELAKLFDQIMPAYYPHWAAAGDRLPWPGDKLLLHEHQCSPTMTNYRHVGDEVVDGSRCDIYEGPERHEKIWIDRKSKLVKAVSRHYASGLSQDANWSAIEAAAEREFDSRNEFNRWHEALPKTEKDQFSARWSALTWNMTRPGNLAVFSDYRPVAAGVQWPHQVDRVVMHRNGDEGFRFYLAKIDVRQITDFEIEQMAEHALPTAGTKVTDRSTEDVIEYVWSDTLTDAEIERIRRKKASEKRALDLADERISSTPIESVDDAIRILREGPRIEPTKLWARAIRFLTQHSDVATPALIEALDQEDRDHPISKLAFAMRAVGDPRAMPALIRALPRTLKPGRSDYGLLLDDDELLPFMQQHDIDREGGRLFTYGRAFREVIGALQRISGQEFDEMELNWVNADGSDLQNQIALRQFEQVAGRWAKWWEGNWKAHTDDERYSRVLLRTSKLTDSTKRSEALPSGAEVKLVVRSSGGTIQSAHDTGEACFFDLDTMRQAAWPKQLAPLGKTTLDAPALMEWAQREGFDVVGITYTPKGEREPRCCLYPLGMKAWRITEDEHRALPEMVSGDRPYALSRPVELLIARSSIPKPRDPQHSGDSFLYVTREGSSGVLRLTAQVKRISNVSGAVATDDHLFDNEGFHRGVRYELSSILP